MDRVFFQLNGYNRAALAEAVFDADHDLNEGTTCGHTGFPLIPRQRVASLHHALRPSCDVVSARGLTQSVMRPVWKTWCDRSNDA